MKNYTTYEFDLSFKIFCTMFETSILQLKQPKMFCLGISAIKCRHVAIRICTSWRGQYLLLFLRCNN